MTDESIKIEQLKDFKGSDFHDICDATLRTVSDGLGFTVGFNYSQTPNLETIEKYWRGVMLVPERLIFVGRIDGVIASSVQLIKPAPSKQNESFYAKAAYHFVAPWARGHGLAQMMVLVMEQDAKKLGISQIRLKIRSTKHQAIKLYETCDYKKYGELERYQMQGDSFVSGYFYYKDI